MIVDSWLRKVERLVLACVLGCGAQVAIATCQVGENHQVSNVLARSVQLNERFKAVARVSQPSSVAEIRLQNERFTEEWGVPCALKGSELLLEIDDSNLIAEIVSFGVSHSNSAGGGVGDALARAFAARPESFVDEVKRRPGWQATALKRPLYAGWGNLKGSLDPSEVPRLEELLRSVLGK